MKKKKTFNHVLPDPLSSVPAELLDDEGYPTEEWLAYIRNYKPDVMPVHTFVEKVLINGWYMSDWGFKLHKPYKGKRKLELHTGGWSGNEETIAAIKSNRWFTHFKMRYVKWETGGHYYFELSCELTRKETSENENIKTSSSNYLQYPTNNLDYT